MADETPKPKQYLLMVDEMNMSFLSRLVPAMQFALVEAMPVKDNDGYFFLVNPVPKAKEPVPEATEVVVEKSEEILL